MMIAKLADTIHQKFSNEKSNSDPIRVAFPIHKIFQLRFKISKKTDHFSENGDFINDNWFHGAIFRQ